MYNKAVRGDSSLLQYVPDWLVTLQEMWCDGFDNDDELFDWYNYQQCNVWKKEIKEEQLPIAWYPVWYEDL